MSFTSRSSTRCSQSSLESSFIHLVSRGESNPSGIHQGVLFFITRETVLPEPDLREGKCQNPASLVFLSHLSRRGEKKNTLRVTAQGHRFTQRLRPSCRSIACFPPPTSPHLFIKGLLPSTSCLAFSAENYKAY